MGKKKGDEPAPSRQLSPSPRAIPPWISGEFVSLAPEPSIGLLKGAEFDVTIRMRGYLRSDAPQPFRFFLTATAAHSAGGIDVGTIASFGLCNQNDGTETADLTATVRTKVLPQDETITLKADLRAEGICDPSVKVPDIVLHLQVYQVLE